MDLAQTLVRSVARAFYDPRAVDTRHIVIVDALIIHSALRDDDLAYLMSQNTKDLHKICGRLKEDRFIQVHVRPELREGQQRPTNRTYYYIDYRQAIDAIKWKVYALDKAVQGNAIPAQEKKEYFCSFCNAEWTTMEVLDSWSIQGFKCHRCSRLLVHDPERQSGGHVQSTRLNNQLKFITDLLPQLDSVFIPDNTFEAALAAARPVERDATNRVAASTVVETEAKPTAVRGLADMGPKSIAINITAADGPSEAEKEAERIRKEKIAQQNALPEWHTTSTVSGITFAEVASASSFKKEDDDTKADNEDLTAEDAEDLNEWMLTLKRQAEAEAARKALEDDEDEEDDEEEEEFEDITATNESSTGAEKRGPSSGDTSAADTPASDEKAAKKVKVEEPTNKNDSEDEDMAFEDV